MNQATGEAITRERPINSRKSRLRSDTIFTTPAPRILRMLISLARWPAANSERPNRPIQEMKIVIAEAVFIRVAVFCSDLYIAAMESSRKLYEKGIPG